MLVRATADTCVYAYLQPAVEPRPHLLQEVKPGHSFSIALSLLVDPTGYFKELPEAQTCGDVRCLKYAFRSIGGVFIACTLVHSANRPSMVLCSKHKLVRANAARDTIRSFR